MGRSDYVRRPCFLCKQGIKNNGLAMHSHRMAHVRRGELVRMRNKTNYFEIIYIIPECEKLYTNSHRPLPLSDREQGNIPRPK